MKDIINWCNENQGFLMAILTGVYVLATVILVIVSHRANVISLKNVEALTSIEKERLRPLVEARLESDVPFIILRVSNQGQTPAYAISFDISPRLQLLLGGEGSYPSEKSEREIGIIEKGIGSLGGGACETAIVGTLSRIKEVFPEMRFTGTLRYRSGSGTEYATPIDLDVRYMEGSLHVRHKNLHDIANELENIRREIGHIGSGFHTLHVITQDVKKKREEDKEFIAKANKQIDDLKRGIAQSNIES